MALKGGGSGYALLTKELIHNGSVVDIPLIKATAESLHRYGSIITNEDAVMNEFKNETWPKTDGWRKLSNGTGNEAQPATGHFNHFWRNMSDENDNFYMCCANNVALSRNYETAIYDSSNQYLFVREMNYHLCGNQLFWPLDKTPYIVLLGRSKENTHCDDIDFDDIKTFYFDGTEGLNIFAGTWHQPSFPYHIDQELKLLNVQSSVHSCVVFDSLDEYEKLMRISTMI